MYVHTFFYLPRDDEGWGLILELGFSECIVE
jgi:hypothetical protein